MANVSLKKLQIDKATKTMVISASVAVFITIFSLVAGHSLYKVLTFQNALITNQIATSAKLKQDIASKNKLFNSYYSLIHQNPNELGQQINGSGQNSGNNAKLILDALPSQYDYPAFASSLEYLLTQNGVTITSFTGGDQSTTTGAGSTPAPATPTGSPSASTVNLGSSVPIPFTFSVTGSYTAIQSLFKIFTQSIRPFDFQTIELSGSDSGLTLTASGQAYYQPAITFKVTHQELTP